MADVKTRWQKADDNFRKQIDRLKCESGVKNLHRLSAEAGLPAQRLNKIYDQPRLMRKFEERLLMILFSRYGLTYDVTFGEGAAA